MKEDAIYRLRFPIGPFVKPDSIEAQHILDWIAIIQAFPEKIKYATDDLNSTQLNWIYRPGGWSIKQVVNHCADSHMNSFIRFKLALTEDQPKIRPYNEALWAELSDSLEDEITDAVGLITHLHRKWVTLLKKLTVEELNRTFIHPEHGQKFSLAENIGIYAWHCTHHLTHIRLAIDFQGKFNKQ